MLFSNRILMCNNIVIIKFVEIVIILLFHITHHVCGHVAWKIENSSFRRASEAKQDIGMCPVFLVGNFIHKYTIFLSN